jgi:murein DD-endopeptidase MepM/ murein hydrolase activator NlpD
MGTPVLAMAAGRVTLAGRVADGAVVVMIDHGSGVITLYGHLEPTLAVSKGDEVATGQLLGSVGLTGHTTGPHLHLEVWSGGVPIDPLTVLPPRP